MKNRKSILKKSILLAITVMLLLMSSISVSAAFTAKRSGVNYPGTLKAGQTFILKGTITANEVISKAIVTIYDSKGVKCLQRYTEYPRKKVFAVSNADAAMEFNRLSAGSYYYRISVYNNSNKKIRVLSKKFKVSKTASQQETIKRNGVTVPVTLKTGTAFQMKGTLQANFKMKSVAVNICDSKGTKSLQRYEAKVNAATYNIANADSHIRFDKLPAGTYLYRITVYNQSGKKYRVVDTQFTVQSGSPTIVIVKPVPEKDVTIKAGSILKLGGKIVSKNKMNKVTAAVTRGDGTVMARKEVNPNATTYVLDNSIIDTGIAFEKLPKGTYRLTISGSDILGAAYVVKTTKIVVN